MLLFPYFTIITPQTNVQIFIIIAFIQLRIIDYHFNYTSNQERKGRHTQKTA